MNRNIKLLENEEFRTVKIDGEVYPNYLISNMGRLYSFKHRKLLKRQINGRNRVKYIIYKNGKPKCVFEHRLVAYAFVHNPYPDKYKITNHIDEVTTNNVSTNIEWCDHKYNLNYGSAQAKRIAKLNKKVLQFDSNFNLVAEHESLTIASKNNGISTTPIFNGCHKGTFNKGYYWQYAN